jgi:hypothetical protein
MPCIDLFVAGLVRDAAVFVRKEGENKKAM